MSIILIITNIFKHFNIDLILFFAVIIISIFGIMMIYSSSSIWAEYKFDDAFKYLKHQSIFLIIGIILMIIISKIPYTYYLNKANIILLVCFFLLILVLIPGVGTVRNGSRSWLGFGSASFQPSEMVKFFMIVFYAGILTKNSKESAQRAKSLRAE